MNDAKKITLSDLKKNIYTDCVFQKFKGIM